MLSKCSLHTANTRFTTVQLKRRGFDFEQMKSKQEMFDTAKQFDAHAIFEVLSFHIIISQPLLEQMVSF